MAITIRDIAREAGVSTATASRALRRLHNVDPATIARVQAVADRYSYAVSPAASRLAGGRTGSVAALTPYMSRWYFSTVLSGVERVLQEAETDLLLLVAGDPGGHGRTPPVRRLSQRVDGFLVISLDPDSPELGELLEFDAPKVLIGTKWPGVPSVSIDDERAARLATQHLLNLGHRRIGLIAGRPGRSPFLAERARRRGFETAVAWPGSDSSALEYGYGDFTVDGGETAMNALLAQPDPPTAVFCMSDEMAFGAMRALRLHGLAVGRDVSLVGFDGHDLSGMLELTTVAQPVAQIGAAAAQLLLAQISGVKEHEPAEVDIPTTLVVRSSSRPPT